MSTRWHFVIQGSMSLDSLYRIWGIPSNRYRSFGLDKNKQIDCSNSRKGFAFPELFRQSLFLSVVVKKSKNILVCMIKSPMIGVTVHSYASLLNVL